MAMKHIYIPLDKATIVSRRHLREVQPPGMVDIINFIPSRSDASLTLRPDMWYTQDNIYGVSSLLNLPSSSVIRDFLNSANGLYGSSQVTYFTTYVPYGNDNGTWRVLSGTHSSGTVSGKSGSADVTGTGTEFLQNAHRGAIMRVDGAYSGTYTGSYYIWTASSLGTNEYYMTTAAGGDPSLKGDWVSRAYYFGNTYDITYFIPGLAGTLGASGVNIAFDDNDTLGYNTVYIRNDSVDPDSDAFGNGYLMWFETSVNISGANYTWTSSGSGTNEYYMTTRAAGDPGLSGDAASSYSTVNWFYNTKGSSVTSSPNNHYTYSSLLTAGTVGSLANLEFDIGDNDALGYNTIYLRSNGGDPDDIGTPTTIGTVYVSTEKDITSASYKWSPSNTYSNTYYLEASGGGDPSIDNPTSVYINDVYGINDLTPDTDNDWFYGDADTLGYNTIYVYRSDGDPDATGITIKAFYQEGYNTSKYRWTASGSGTNEYYCELAGGGDPSLDDPYAVYLNVSTSLSKGSPGTLTNSQWGYGDNDTLGYNTIYFRYDTGDPDAEGVCLRSVYRYRVYSTGYKWEASGSGTNEYYVVTTAGGDPSISAPGSVYVSDVLATEGTVGSLNNGEWDYGDNDTLGFNTIYYRNDAADPDGAVGTGTADYTTLPVILKTLAANESIYDYYLVDRIESDSALKVYGELATDLSGSAVQFYYNHNPFLSPYKLNIQAYTSGLVYNQPTIRDNIDEEDISGPFYADLQDGEWAYGGKVIVDDEFEGDGVAFENQPFLATNGTSYVQIFGTITPAGTTDMPQYSEGGILAYASAIAGKNPWTKYTFNSSAITISGDAGDMRLNSIQAVGSTYICAAQVINSDGSACYPGIAYSTDAFSWTVRADINMGAWAEGDGSQRADTDNQAICAAWNGSSPGRIVCLFWRPSDNRVTVRYSDNSGDTWSNASIGGGGATYTGSRYNKVYYLNSQFIIVDDTQLFYGDGSSFTAQTITGASKLKDIAFNGADLWVLVEEDFETWFASSITGTWTNASLSPDMSSFFDATNFVVWDVIGERFIINSSLNFYYSDDGETWKSDIIRSYGEAGSTKWPTNMISDFSGVYFTLYDGGADYFRQFSMSRFNYSYWDVVDFVPLSDIYRSSTFSVIDGYVVLLGTREYSAGSWTYYPRRIRWTAPATYNDFTSTGTGTADANGEGAFLDSRPCNGRILVFETNRVSAVVPRGDVEDPFDYDIIKEDFRVLSNPVVVDDKCYVIGTDGLLYISDGINLEESGSSFDASKFDDFTEDKPIMLDYSPQLSSLVAYYFDSSAANHYAYFISTSSGVVTRIELPELSDSGGLSEVPAAITSVSDSSDQRVIVSHHPLSSATDVVVTTSLAAGKSIVGLDKPVFGSNTGDSNWYGLIDTGELYLAPEGKKARIKHVIIRTYSGASIGSGTGRPRIILQYRSLEDTEWKTAGPQDVSGGDWSLTDASFYGTYTAWSAKIGDGNDVDVDFFLPVYDPDLGGIPYDLYVNPATASIYLEESGSYTQQIYGTDYTTGLEENVVSFTTPPTSFQSIYYSWNNKPEIIMEAGDFILSPIGYHRVTGITNASVATLDRYAPTGLTYSLRDPESYNGSITGHYKSQQIPDGDGEVKIGLNALVEGVRFRIIVIPEYGSSAAPTTVKVTGMTIGFIPTGRKILEATGS